MAALTQGILDALGGVGNGSGRGRCKSGCIRAGNGSSSVPVRGASNQQRYDVLCKGTRHITPGLLTPSWLGRQRLSQGPGILERQRIGMEEVLVGVEETRRGS